MFTLADPFSSPLRPVMEGRRGAISCENPLAAAAGLRAFERGGGAADALISAQAVLAVISPDACGLGGDMLALVHAAGGDVTAINGTGCAPAGWAGEPIEGANAITVPGLVGAWTSLHAGHGTLPLAELLAPAIALAEEGFRVTSYLAGALVAQRDRLLAGGAESWPLFDRKKGDLVRLPELAALLRAVADRGATAFYEGEIAQAVERAVRPLGGTLRASDLAAHETVVSAPNSTSWAGLTVMTQPPMTQGILLNMSLAALEAASPEAGRAMDHAGIELTEAAFAYRARAGAGMALMSEALTYDPERALHRGGPRAYLHTAGVACADADGCVVSSLVSVFDDFGSAVYVPEGGFTLNNRAAGFGPAPNDAAAGKRPVHTLAPALLTGPDGSVWALATPGADGQVQTLLQVLSRARLAGEDLAAAVAAPRWRSENGQLLIEESHPEIEALRALGHALKVLPAGDLRFGAVVAAGLHDGSPRALADWRRLTTAGVA
ncbi:gamma-glutamyltransferase family protein [Alloyangia pacifica]|uniref:Gamma-glutamyltranspeptidase / glutathione hydrolase n=1 Tax=Alloyangia pacifica TaxID=311180 RepID=A0A1I6WFW9_9RHOB|nr:gamma-glutamyltransferase [Alloyangia pacifica]SDI72067.1 gamma-glutamyltranspeptidase / glutathione hydrolase [Alloyangia pacifica]SFT24866.1 gamma-glutamyltranspeptidase / glutathione hydrolase [Alloyangia pacifica]